MKSLKGTLLFLVLMVLPFILNSAMNCECGSHSEGITTYNVVGGDCCASIPGPTGYIHSYEQQENGVWEHTGSTIISGSSAQDHCCNSSI